MRTRAAVTRLALAVLCLTGTGGGVATLAHAKGHGAGSDIPARHRAESDAAFRTDARLAYRALQPVCPQTSKPELLALYVPLLRQLSRVEQRAAGTRHAAILNAERQANLDMAAVVDCARPDGPNVTKAGIATTLHPVGPALSRLYRTVSTSTPRRR